MKVLVTGCAGFIGSTLSDYLLEHNYKVVGIDCFTDSYSKVTKKSNLRIALENNNFRLIEKDILDIYDFPKVSYVFHLAAQAGVRASWGENFHIYTRNNIGATQKLLEYYKDKKIKKFVYSSSSSVYGDTELPMSEKSMLKPVSPYGVTKLAAENLCYLYWKNYEVPTISLRYFTVYGPRQRPDMAIHRFVNAIIEEKEIKLFGDGKQTRDFTYIDDVIRANVLAAKSEFTGEVLNIGVGNRISILELIKKIEYIVGKKARIKRLVEQKGDAEDTLADVSKANELLNWTPNFKIEKGLSNYVQWLKNY